MACQDPATLWRIAVLSGDFFTAFSISSSTVMKEMSSRLADSDERGIV
jgi:hypothetical protein